MTESMERTAAQWLARMRSDNVSAADRESFLRWLEDTPGALESYLAQEALWDLTQLQDCDAVAERLLAEDGARKPVVSTAVLAPVKRAGALRRAALCAAVVVALLGGVAQHAFLDVKVVETGVGERQTIALDDGTVLWLNTGSRVKVHYDTAARHVRLDRGEVFFDVTRDERRPFHVRTPAGTVTVLGTRFNVSATGGRTSVAVIEGAVKVPAPEQKTSRRENEHPMPQVLTAGHYVQYDARGPSYGEISDPKTAIGWTEGKLYFNAVPLASAIAQYQRYVKQPIILLEPSLANEIVSGVFVIGDLKTFFNALYKSFRLEVKIEGGAIILERPREMPVTSASL